LQNKCKKKEEEEEHNQCLKTIKRAGVFVCLTWSVYCNDTT